MSDRHVLRGATSSLVKCVGAFTLLVACAAVSAGCFGARAQTVAAQPLDVPPPPPRTVEVRNPDVPPPVPLPEEPPRTQPSAVLAPPARPAEPPRPAEPAKSEPPSDASRPAEEGIRAPTTTLQTTPAQQEGELERRIRMVLLQAGHGLNRVNYQALNADGRTQYDTAKRFISQAEEAVRAKNLVFASNLAEKAAALASQLSGR
jgi:hypothetical protein